MLTWMANVLMAYLSQVKPLNGPEFGPKLGLKIPGPFGSNSRAFGPELFSVYGRREGKDRGERRGRESPSQLAKLNSFI